MLRIVAATRTAGNSLCRAAASCNGYRSYTAEAATAPPIRFATKRKPPTTVQEALAKLRLNAKDFESLEITVKTDTRDPNNKKRKRDPFRGNVIFPHQFRKEPTVLVFARGEDVEIAKAAGAQIVGDDSLVNEILENTVKPDYLLATPDMAKVLKKHARQLRSSLPTEKKGLVHEEIGELVNKYLHGIPYRSDSQGYVRMAVGKVKANFTVEMIEENLATSLQAIKSHQLSTSGKFIQELQLSRTQGKGGTFYIKPDEVLNMLKSDD
eukprot:m.339453 g.339453  ORF g.339453 m.339453 type:complete len:267 (-) comp18810_c0_seq1:106-906(-)